MRTATVKRKTKETDIEVSVDLDGKGTSTISTGIGFLHPAEDPGIALGQAVKQALGDMKGITRYADVHVPMDEALTRVCIDISGRPFLVFKAAFSRPKVGT